jgi:methanogenic corrinoid protein MtbC1
MVSDDTTRELIKKLHDAVVAMDEETAVKTSTDIIEGDIDAYYAIMNGLATAMDEVGQLYARFEYFVPELLLCSDALYASLEVMKPHIKAETVQEKKQIIIGVIEGDIHDIGKNLVKIMFEAAGWTVHDLGRDVKVARFAEEQKRINADIVAMSALMTTSMLALPEAIKMIKASDTGVGIILGGAPLTREIALSYGADGYAANAGQAVQEALRVLAK